MRDLPVALAVVMASVAAVVAAGCGSGDCTETATCAETAEGGSGSDGSGPDVTLDSPEGSSGSSSGGGPDGSIHPDAGKDAPNDAEMLPDVPFVDSSSCPTGSMCVDAVPSGWSGPVLLYDGTGTPPPIPPACPSTYPNDAYDGNAGPGGSPATCGCSCGPVMNASCDSMDLMNLQVFTDGNCQTQCGSDIGLLYTTMGFCTASGCSTGAMSAIITEPSQGTGDCNAIPSTNAPPATWSEVARVCAPTSVGGGCSGSQVCVPNTVSPFLGKVCIVQTGAASCPSGSSYSMAHTFYGAFDDSRGCTTNCTCNVASGITCSGGTAALYPTFMNPACAGTAQDVPVDGQCHSVSFSSYLYGNALSAPTPSGGSCTVATSPTPTGGVSGSMPTTVCCAQ
jgi:hypothetical protein